MYFDGAVNNKGAGIRVILIIQEGEMIPMEKRLEYEVTTINLNTKLTSLA